MPGQETSSGFEHFARNVFTRIGTIVTGIAAVATALHQLAHDIVLTAEGLVMVLAIVSSAFVVLWRSSEMVDDKKVSTPFFPQTQRFIAAAVLVLGIAFAVPYSIQITNIVILRDKEEKQLAAIPFLVLTPSPTITATATTAPTATATATPTVVPGATQTLAAQAAQATALAHSAWSIVLFDSFTSNSSGWQIGPPGPNLEPGSSTRSIANGKLVAQLKGNRRYIQIFWPTYYVRPFSDFYTTLEVQRVSGPMSADYGLVFRYDPAPNNSYVVSFSDNRTLTIQTMFEGRSTQLVRLDQVSAIKQGAVNRLGVIAQGTHFDVLINDQLITSFDDSRFKDGKIGVWAGVAAAGDEVVLEYSNFQVRAP